jgi:hypothetical protein
MVAGMVKQDARWKRQKPKRKLKAERKLPSFGEFVQYVWEAPGTKKTRGAKMKAEKARLRAGGLCADDRLDRGFMLPNSEGW